VTTNLSGDGITLLGAKSKKEVGDLLTLRKHTEMGNLDFSPSGGSVAFAYRVFHPGEPSPKYLSMKERSESLRDVFPLGSSGNRLFSRLREVAVEMLNRERLDDEQMGFE